MSTNDSNRDWFAPPPGQPPEPSRPPEAQQRSQPGQPARPAHPGPAQPVSPQRPGRHALPEPPAYGHPGRPPHGQPHPSRGEPTQPLHNQPAQQPPYGPPSPRPQYSPPPQAGQPPQPGRPYRSQQSQQGYQGQQGQPPPRGPIMPPRRGPLAYPDQQVWPPPSQQEPPGSSTQPLPAAPSAGLLPRQPPQTSAAQEPVPRKPRTLLLGVSALVAFLLAVGIPTGDQYLFYKSGQPDDIVHEVPKGQEMAFEHVSWKASIEPMAAPQGSTGAADRQWLKVTITRKALDDTGKVLTGQPELSFEDKQDRAWKVLIAEDEVTGRDMEVGRSYTYVAGAVVPKAVAGEVELHLRPDTTYRSDTPTEKLMQIKPEEEEKSKHRDVLVFKR